MDDLISRRAAIDAIHEWGLIDGLAEGQAIEILYDEEKVPSAQQEIIRCKDCMHNGSYDTDCPIDWNGKEYCSFAERKEDE